MNEWVYEREGLSIKVSSKASVGRIQWLGSSDSRHPAAFLNPLCEELSVRLQNSDVTIDLTGLDYMNSATVKPLLDMVKLLDTKCRRVIIVFRSSDWQRTHRNCMLALARTLKNTHVE